MIKTTRPEINQASFNTNRDSLVVATTTGFLVFSLDNFDLLVHRRIPGGLSYA